MKIAQKDSVTIQVRLIQSRFKQLESFEMLCWKRMEKIKWSEKVTHEQVLDHIGEKRTLLNNILHFEQYKC